MAMDGEGYELEQRQDETVEQLVNAATAIGEDQARLNVTWSGTNGDLPDPVPRDASDADILQWATEAVQTGGIPGIDADPNASFQDFVVDRFDAKDGLPSRVVIRPKTPFGSC